MNNIKVTFSEEVTQEEFSWVEADTKEAAEMVENGEYDEVNIISANVIDNKDFIIQSIEVIE